MRTFNGCYEQHNKTSLSISKVKGIPLQTWRGPEVSRSLKYYTAVCFSATAP